MLWWEIALAVAEGLGGRIVAVGEEATQAWARRRSRRDGGGECGEGGECGGRNVVVAVAVAVAGKGGGEEHGCCCFALENRG